MSYYSSSYLQGFNAVLTDPVDSPDRRDEDQIREVELGLNPDLKSILMELCCDLKTTIVVLSGSNKFALDNVIPLSTTFLFTLLSCWCKCVCAFTELLWVQDVVGGREWDFFAFWNGKMENNNTRTLKCRLDWVHKGTQRELPSLPTSVCILLLFLVFQ